MLEVKEIALEGRAFIPAIPSTSEWLHSDFVCLLFYKLIGKLTSFLQFNFRNPTCDQFHYHRVVFSSHLKSKIWRSLNFIF